MLGIKLICVGKMKEKYYMDAVAEYTKRLRVYCKFELVELPEYRVSDHPSDKEIEAALEKEAYEIEKQIPQGAAVIALCIEGRKKSSVELAKMMEQWAATGKSRLCFLIGGSFGMHASIKQRADLQLSMSDMTFPHHLARVMLVEQIYRGFTICEGTRYHK